MGKHSGNSLLTVQKAYYDAWREAVEAGRQPPTWPESPTRHDKPPRERVAMGGPPVDRPQYRVRRGLVVGMFAMLLGACVPVDGESAPHTPPAAPTTGPTPSPLGLSVVEHGAAPFVAALLGLHGGGAR